MAAKRQTGFVFLDTGHFLIRERLERKLLVERAEGFEGKPEYLYSSCCDFNNMELLAMCRKSDNVLHVSAKVPCFGELETAGVQDVLKEVYGDMLQEDPNSPYSTKSGWNATVSLDLKKVPEDTPAEELVEKMSSLGHVIYSAPFYKAFEALNDGKTKDFAPLTLQYRDSEQVFVVASPHVVQVIYSLSFEDQVDRELARVFSVEFAEAGRVVGKAPGVNFYPPDRKPDQLADLPHTVDDTCIGYVVFAVAKNHIDKPAKMKRVADLLVQFRSYVLYHIKCTKTHLHSMMRKTYANLLQVKERCTPKGKVLNIKAEKEE